MSSLSSCSDSSRSTTSKHSINYDGKTIETTVTDSATIANAWAQEMINSCAGKPLTVVGLDIEWRPHAISYMSNKSATLQLCIDNKCLILQLFYIDAIPEVLKTFLQNPNFTFVGIEVSGDIEKLENEYGLTCEKSADIRELAKKRFPGRFRRPGLKDLAMEVCGLHMPKPRHVTMSNWEARELTPSQVEYGCIDAYASFKIGHRLLLEN